MSENNQNEPLKNLWITSVIILLVVTIFPVSIYFILSTWEGRGQFWDIFGALNTLFSGLAFAGIIYTVLLQRKELQLQREELMQTREELKRSADAQEKSELALKEQINSMKLTAKLNALNSLVTYYSKQEKDAFSYNNAKTGFDYQNKRIICINKIELILNNLAEE